MHIYFILSKLTFNFVAEVKFTPKYPLILISHEEPNLYYNPDPPHLLASLDQTDGYIVFVWPRFDSRGLATRVASVASFQKVPHVQQSQCQVPPRHTYC